MKRTSLNIESVDLTRVLIPRLIGTVFHVTRLDSLASILSSGSVRNNKSGDFPFSFPESEKSYGRSQGYVCLFDLRGRSFSEAENINVGFSFTDPFQPVIGWEPIVSGSTTYLFLRQERFASLLDYRSMPTNAEARVHIRDGEVWYPGDLPLDCIERVLSINIDRTREREHFDRIIRDTNERIADLFPTD